MPPSLLADDSERSRRVRWTLNDRIAIRAYELFESSLCPSCSQDRHRAFNPDMNGWYDIVGHQCQSCNALESERSKSNQPKGMKHFVVDNGPPSDELMPFVIDLRTDAERKSAQGSGQTE